MRADWTARLLALRAELLGAVAPRGAPPPRGPPRPHARLVDALLLAALLESFLARVGRSADRRHVDRILGLPAELRAHEPALAAATGARPRLEPLLAEAPWIAGGALALDDAARALAGHDERSAFGKFYTPAPVVEHVLARTLTPMLRRTPLADLRLLEPSVGSGDFAVAAYEQLVAAWRTAGAPAADAFRRALTQNLHAVDVDPIAVAVTRLRLYARALDAVALDAADLDGVRCGNTLREAFGADLREAPEPELPFAPAGALEEPGAEVAGRGARPPVSDPSRPAPAPPGGARFHVIVGNPPYGARIAESERAWLRRRYGLAAEGRLETAALFLERCLELLAPRGALGLVLPHAFTRSGGYRAARALLRRELELTSLLDLGAAFPGVLINTMALTGVRGAGRRGGVDLFVHRVGGITRSARIPRAFLAQRDALPMHVRAEDVALWTRIEARSRPLREVVRNERGYNLPKRAARIRPPVRGTDSATGSAGDRVPVLRGRDLAPYALIEPSGLATVPRADLRSAVHCLEVPTIAVQNVSNVIEATVVPAGVLPLDTVNLLTPVARDVDRDYLVAVLNSSLAERYLRDVLVNRATLTVHLDDPTLGALPIVVPEREHQRRVARDVRRLLGLDGPPPTGEARTALVAAIDRAVSEIYEA